MGGVAAEVLEFVPSRFGDAASMRADAPMRPAAIGGFERVARIASILFGAPWAAVVSFAGGKFEVRAQACPENSPAPLDAELCAAILGCALGEVIWTGDAGVDARFTQHPAVSGPFGLRFFAAAPIRSHTGVVVGGLCVLDGVPRRALTAEVEALRELAAMAGETIEEPPAEPARAGNGVFAVTTPTRATAPVAAGGLADVSELRPHLLPKLVEHSSEILGLIGADGRVQYAAGAVRPLLGYAADEILKQDFFEFIHPEDLPRSREALAKVFTNAGGKVEHPVRLRHREGRWVQIDLTAQNLVDQPGLNGIFLRVRDGADRLRQTSDMREFEERYRRLFEDNPQPMWAFDLETQRFLAVNDATLRHYGYTREEFMDLSLDDLRPAEDVPLFRAHINRRIEAPVRRTWRHRKRDGEIITVEIYATTVRIRGRKARLVAMQDITERTNAVESLKRRNRYMAAQVELQLELLKPRPLLESIRALLASLGKASGASRAYYYLNSTDGRTGQLYALPSGEWCAPGIFSETEIFGNERISYDAYDKRWLQRLQAGEALPLNVEALAEPERSLFSAGGVRSALLAPVLVRGNFIGFLGLDDCTSARRWDRSEADLVQGAAAALALALEAETVSQNLDEEKDRFAVTLGSIADGVVTTDAGGRIVFANRVAETLLGRTQQELSGCELGTFFHIGTPTGGVRADPIPRVLQSGEVVIQPSGAFVTHKSGVRVPVAKSSAPIRNRTGKIIGAVRVFRDTTPEQRMASEMAKASKLESIGILAGGIAHDFNNILTAVVGNISLAKMFLHAPDRAAAKLDEAERASFRARDLTAQLLTFSKGGAPVKKLAKIHEIIRESVDFAMHGSKVVVRFSLPDDLPPMEVDAGQLSQVINNLAINAVQAMVDGGTMDVWAQERELEEGHPTGLPPGRYVKICVEDTGGGIAPEDQSKIFDPFFTTKDHGSGLGLATSYSIIKNHGGLINFDSIVGQGTIFRVYLPASEEPASAADTAVLGAGAAPIYHGAGRVLLMDDEVEIRELAASMLEQLGYDVVAVPDGQLAIAQFERALAIGHPFDVLILDLTIPGGLGGAEVIERVRGIDPGVRAIVSSGYANAPIMADYQRYGFADILSKPYRVEEISAAMARVLGPAAEG